MAADVHASEPTHDGSQSSRRRRPQFTLATVFTILTLTAVLVLLNREWLRDAFGVKEPELLRPIETAADLEEALNAERAVVFVHVRWSITSLLAKKQFEEMIRFWRRRDAAPFVSFYVLDATDYGRKKPLAIQQWMKSHPVLKRTRSSGAGEAVWLREGEVVHTTMDVIPAVKLVEIGRATFKE